MKTDVAVIGAGALGLSTAVHGALRGRSVAVLDRRDPGPQASGRAAARRAKPSPSAAAGCSR
jgi:glycine/D-amino acid oxidase-like deaminating enzyme